MILPTMPTQPGRPRLILAHPDPAYTARAYRYFRQFGLDVWMADTALEVRRLVRKLRPAVAVLATNLPDESGWLTCTKLVRQQPGLKVLLLDTAPTAEDHRFADFVGAAGLFQFQEDLGPLLETALDLAMPAGWPV